MKERLPREAIAVRVALELRDGDVVNIGTGVASLAGGFIPPDCRVIIHSENGIIGHAGLADLDEIDYLDPNRIDAGAHYVRVLPGTAICDMAEAFDAIRTGRVDVTILGGLQVSEKGDLANWSKDPTGKVGFIGGAMDMAAGAKKVIVGMEHVTKTGDPRVVKQCTLPLTAKRRVNLIVTDVAVIEVTEQGLLLREMTPGWTVEDVQEITEPRLLVAPDLREMVL